MLYHQCMRVLPIDCTCVLVSFTETMARTSPGVVFLTLLQIGCSVTVIALTNGFLLADSPWVSHGQICFLNGDERDTSLCNFALAVGLISISSALLSGLLRCVSCNFCGLGPVSNIVLAIINSIWWLISAAILTAGAVAADASHLPKARYRHALLAAAWTAAIGEFVHSILACVVVGNNVCSWMFGIPANQHDEDCCSSCEECCSGWCCPCCCPRPRHRHNRPLLPSNQAAGMAAGVTAAAVLSQRNWWGRVSQQQPGGVTAAAAGGQQSGFRPYAAWRPSAAGAAAQQPAGSYMPPPPTAGQPYVYQPAAAAAAASGTALGVPLPAGSSYPAPKAAASGSSSSSFGGFAHPAAAGCAAGTPTGFNPGSTTAAAAAPLSAPYAPPLVLQQQQQQQQHVAPSVPNMRGDYPVISKE